jgi:hypothetical protein
METGRADELDRRGIEVGLDGIRHSHFREHEPKD